MIIFEAALNPPPPESDEAMDFTSFEFQENQEER
jgi:hypothetical protein